MKTPDSILEVGTKLHGKLAKDIVNFRDMHRRDESEWGIPNDGKAGVIIATGDENEVARFSQFLRVASRT